MFKHHHEELRQNRKLHVVTASQGNSSKQKKVIFFVHGLGGRVEQWYSTMEYFVSKYDDCMCLGYDWLGHGESEKPNEWDAYHWSELVSDMEAVMHKFCQMEDEIYLVAHSFGSGLSMHHLSKSEARIKKLVLIGTAINGPPSAKNYALYAPNFFLEWTRGLVKNQFRRACYHENTAEHVVLAEQEAASKNPMFVIKYILRQMNWPQSHEISSIQVPTLVFTGETDRVMPVDHGKAVAELIRDSKFVVLQNSGHAPMIEVPSESHQLIDDFLSMNL